MQKRILWLIGVWGAVSVIELGQAQTLWYYQRSIGFPSTDTTRVRPYAITVDRTGKLWVISSTATDTSAHNSIWKAAPTDAAFSKIADFGSVFDTSSASYLDPNVGALRGISALGNNIYLSGTQPQSVNPATLVGFIFLLRGGSTSDSAHYGYQLRGGGYGTIIDVITMASDSMAFVGCPYDPTKVGPSFRCYNFTAGNVTGYDKAGAPSSRGVGFFLLGDPASPFSAYYSPAPGGAVNGTTAYDQLRSIALVPGMKYSDSAWAKTNSFFYTSRTGDPTLPTSNGNVAVWKGGYDRQPSRYSASQLSDVAGYLSLGRYTYYGIAADSSGNLFVCRPDSGFRWVKVFNVSGTFATEIASFPSKNDLVSPDPNGAPMLAPMAIALSSNQKSAYVVDPMMRKVFVFATTPTGVEDRQLPNLHTFELSQNYPNPFNPATVISYTLRKTGRVLLEVYNALGQKVVTVVNSVQSGGKHAAAFDGSKLPSGTYFYSLVTDDGRLTRTMTLLK